MIAKNILKVVLGLTSIAACIEAKKVAKTGEEVCKEVIENLRTRSVDCIPDGKFVELDLCPGDPLTKDEKDYLITVKNSIKSITIGGDNSLKGFEKLDKLKELKIYDIDDFSCLKGIDKIPNLKKLSLKKIDSSLTELPEVIGKLTKLESLDVEENSLSALPSNFSKLKNLKELNIKENGFEGEIPSEIFHLDNLEILDISENDFDKIPRKIKYLEKLVEFRASSCGIIDVTSKIGSLKHLKVLDLADNSLEKFPEDLGKLSNLEILDLGDNSIIDDMPEDLNKLSNLLEIYLGGNVNIRGQTLSNASLEVCGYEDDYDLCMKVEMDCLANYQFLTCTKADKISTNKRCGPKYGRCPDGKCCSQYGYCGRSSKYCQAGCQPEYGFCEYEFSD